MVCSYPFRAAFSASIEVVVHRYSGTPLNRLARRSPAHRVRLESVTYRAAEFFAGIGLVRSALDRAGIEVVWANDIEPVKARLYAANHPAGYFLLGDVRSIKGRTVPTVDLATASFPCTDLSLAGWRRGLDGDQSGMFWEFARVIGEMGSRRPSVVLLENVPALLSSKNGADLREIVRQLNQLGYSCDLFQMDARWFVPQSRLRLFIVGARRPLLADRPTQLDPTDPLRPPNLASFIERNRDLRWHRFPLALPVRADRTLRDVLERFPPDHSVWWDDVRSGNFFRSLSDTQAERVLTLQESHLITWRTAYRRTRRGIAVWEIRSDAVAGCLRTARGGSSKQAVVEVGRGAARVRWMTAREYARLQGESDTFDFAGVSPNQVMFGFGDAVCVPAIAWIATEYLRPVLESAVVERLGA